MISTRSLSAAATAAADRRRLPPEGRQRAALASRRFAALCCSPQLLREVETPELVSLPALHSLSAWLARHGQHVHLFDFTAELAWGGDEGSWGAAITGCLAVVGAAGQLEELTVHCWPLHTEWLPLMRSLRRLRLQGSPLCISPAISGLTALQSLVLRGKQISIAATSRPPSTITRLLVKCDEADPMPSQVSTLALTVPISWQLCSCALNLQAAAAFLFLFPAVCPAAAAAAPAAGVLPLLG